MALPNGSSVPLARFGFSASALVPGVLTSSSARGGRPPVIESGDLTEAMVYLCGQSGRYVTGITLPVDAGYTIKQRHASPATSRHDQRQHGTPIGPPQLCAYLVRWETIKTTRHRVQPPGGPRWRRCPSEAEVGERRGPVTHGL
jgi:hypothetical protein